VDEKEIRKMQTDLLEEIKSRVSQDEKFRDAFFANPENAINKSDLAARAEKLVKAIPSIAKACTWTCAWTGG
jgi:hypothetical protein